MIPKEDVCRRAAQSDLLKEVPAKKMMKPSQLGMCRSVVVGVESPFQAEKVSGAGEAGGTRGR